MKKPESIKFSKKYSKLSKDSFTTVRWLDKQYILGNIYDIYLVLDNLFHNRYGNGSYRIMKLEIKKICDLSDDFIRADADCTREEFMQMMTKWYSKKKDWKGEQSEIQIVYLSRGVM